MMIRMIESTKHNQQLTHDAFCRTITFTVSVSYTHLLLI